MERTHVILGTHTTRHLRATLLGVSIQRPRPASVVVSIDNDKEEIWELCRECSREFALPLIVTWRAWPGQVRVGQVRNNGVRALGGVPSAECRVPSEGGKDWLHFLDGDSVMPPGMLSESARVRVGRDLVVGGRVLLTEEQTTKFDEAALAHGAQPVELTREQLADVSRRHRRYVWQARFKALGLVKMHKPKVLGANHACTLTMYQRVNGYDETFLGAWREDDDFGRRVYIAGGRAAVAVKNVCVYHLWHPLNPQKRENWSELPEDVNGQQPWLPKAGLNSPLTQDVLHVESVEDGMVKATWKVPG